MDRAALVNQIRHKETYLCIGLDADARKIPAHLQMSEDPIFEFNKHIIDATREYCVAYKVNTAFYEAEGTSGWASLQKTAAYIPDDCLAIADGKRGDIANTSALYARAFFDTMSFDAITVAPYMGRDSIESFLRPRKWTILLAHTSNPSSSNFQTLVLRDTGRMLYEEIIFATSQWASADQLMYVVGAMRPEALDSARRLAPDHFFLVPGVGAQGGDLHEVSRVGMNKECGMLINASRAILYASPGEDFAEQARAQAHALQQTMSQYLHRYA